MSEEFVKINLDNQSEDYTSKNDNHVSNNRPNQNMNKKVKETFDTTLKERILAVVIIVLSYIYYSSFCESDLVNRVLMGIFTVGFVAFGEIFYWNIKRTVESYIFVILTIIVSVAYCFEIGNVWESDSKVLFLHLYAVYWVLVRSNSLAENTSSHLFAWDGLNGFVIMPFNNFTLMPATIADIFSGFKKKEKKRILIIVASVVIGIILFASAMSFLKDSDANFNAMMSFFEIKFEWEYFWRIFVSILVALYLYGLFGGCFRTKRTKIEEDGKKITAFIAKLNKVPSGIWIAFIILFSIFYILFFALQGSYLIEAFSMILPSDYTFAENAHKGFDDMCAVMIINFALMWLANRTAEKRSKALNIAGTVLMIESLIFAVIAFLKLYMYIGAYGFTPLRMQSVWLVVVLAYACVCILISLLTNKKTARIWFVGSAMSLGILTLI